MHSVVIGTAGHIDHGKSALVKALTGTDPDRLKEEQDRGITIDLGFAHFTSSDTDVAFVDVPGHERFVRNMLAGAGGIDAVLLVVDAGESVMPQTREHFDICRLLGIDRGVIALTKIDAVSTDLIARSRVAVEHLVAGSVLEGAPVLEVSARTGVGLDSLRTALIGLAGRPSRRQRQSIVRLPIDRAFTIKGFGAVVTGTLVSGPVTEGDSLVVLPEGHPARVRGVQVHGKRATSVDAPQRTALNVAGIETRALHRGQTLASEGTLAVTTRADVRIDLLQGARGLQHGHRIRVHHGASEQAARVSIAAIQAPGLREWTSIPPGNARVEVPAGASAFVRLRFDSPAVLTRGDRMVLRAGSPLVTIGGAVVLDPEPARLGVRSTTSLPRFQRLDQSGTPVDLLLEERRELGIGTQDLIRRCGLDARQSADLLSAVVDAGDAVRVGDRVVAAFVFKDCESRVLDALAAFHRTHPQENGMARGALRDRVGLRVPETVVSAVIDRLAAGGLICGTDRLALASYAPSVSIEQQQLRTRVEAAIREGALAPPDLTAVATQLGVSVSDVEQLVHALVRDKVVVRMGGLAFHRDALATLKSSVQADRAKRPAGERVTLDVGAFKSRFNLTRKHAIPLLEWLDRERVTRRTGDVRIVL